MDSDPLWDDYCGAAYTDSAGRVSFSATCSDGDGSPPDVYLKVEGRSALGFSVGTHHWTFWDALFEVLLTLGSGFTAAPLAAVDYLTRHATYAWITPERRGNQPTLTFGDLLIGNAFEAEAPHSLFAARQFWAASFSMQRIRSVTGHGPMDFNYTVDAPLGSPTTVWDTVIVNGSSALNAPAGMLFATAHEIGHVTYNTYHSSMLHWLYEDAAAYMAGHNYCEGGHTMTLAWYEGFANWIRHITYGRLDWLSNSLTLPVTVPPTTGPCPGTPGFDREGNVTSLLDLLYFGPLAPRAPLSPSIFACPAGFNRLQDTTGVVRCQRVTTPVCASGRTRRNDGLGRSDICTLPEVDPVPAALYTARMNACRSRPENCPRDIEPARLATCPSGAVEQRVVGPDRCVATQAPTSAFSGIAPLPRGDGTPDHVLAATPGGGQQWFELLDADTMLAFVEAAGTRAHRMEEFWVSWILGWCTSNDRVGLPRFCDPARSPAFRPLAAPTSTNFP